MIQRRDKLLYKESALSPGQLILSIISQSSTASSTRLLTRLHKHLSVIHHLPKGIKMQILVTAIVLLGLSLTFSLALSSAAPYDSRHGDGDYQALVAVNRHGNADTKTLTSDSSNALIQDVLSAMLDSAMTARSAQADEDDLPRAITNDDDDDDDDVAMARQQFSWFRRQTRPGGYWNRVLRLPPRASRENLLDSTLLKAAVLQGLGNRDFARINRFANNVNRFADVVNQFVGRSDETPANPTDALLNASLMQNDGEVPDGLADDGVRYRFLHQSGK